MKVLQDFLDFKDFKNPYINMGEFQEIHVIHIFLWFFFYLSIFIMLNKPKPYLNQF